VIEKNKTSSLQKRFEHFGGCLWLAKFNFRREILRHIREVAEIGSPFFF
jgi:hypothetical protein